MNHSQSRMNWGFLMRWIAITTLTFIVAVGIAYTSMRILGGVFGRALGMPGASVATGVWVGGLICLGLGIGQAIALRGKGLSLTRWALYTAIGGAVAFALYSGLSGLGEPASRAQLALFAGGLLGLGVGLAQWTLLKSRLANAVLWIPVTVAAFLGTAWIAFTLLSDGREWWVLAGMGVVVAGVTGLGAARMFGGEVLSG